MSDGTATTLEELWPIQASLSAQVGVSSMALGARLREAERAGGRIPEALRLEVGRALKLYIDALQAECHELQECLAWKHWYKEAAEGRQYELLDLQNARVEVIDALFFWISLCQILGLEPSDVGRLFEKKSEILKRRFVEGRRQSDHPIHEHENRNVT